ncbi:MAG: hypothetical protein IJM30_04265 [Thermoguttaceae bacterium]|nr:hypothetical protein [Thermoguttaceae bacterium]
MKRVGTSGSKGSSRSKPRAQMLGIGLDNTDGDKRLTRGKNFTLVGGSEETHAEMQETAIKVNETLERKGKTLEETSPEEFRDILFDVVDRIRR